MTSSTTEAVIAREVCAHAHVDRVAADLSWSGVGPLAVVLRSAVKVVFAEANSIVPDDFCRSQRLTTRQVQHAFDDVAASLAHHVVVMHVRCMWTTAPTAEESCRVVKLRPTGVPWMRNPALVTDADAHSKFTFMRMSLLVVVERHSGCWQLARWDGVPLLREGHALEILRLRTAPRGHATRASSATEDKRPAPTMNTLTTEPPTIAAPTTALIAVPTADLLVLIRVCGVSATPRHVQAHWRAGSRRYTCARAARDAATLAHVLAAHATPQRPPSLSCTHAGHARHARHSPLPAKLQQFIDACCPRGVSLTTTAQTKPWWLVRPLHAEIARMERPRAPPRLHTRDVCQALLCVARLIWDRRVEVIPGAGGPPRAAESLRDHVRRVLCSMRPLTSPPGEWISDDDDDSARARASASVQLVRASIMAPAREFACAARRTVVVCAMLVEWVSTRSRGGASHSSPPPGPHMRLRAVLRVVGPRNTQGSAPDAWPRGADPLLRARRAHPTTCILVCLPPSGRADVWPAQLCAHHISKSTTRPLGPSVDPARRRVACPRLR